MPCPSRLPIETKVMGLVDGPLERPPLHDIGKIDDGAGRGRDDDPGAPNALALKGRAVDHNAVAALS